MEPLFSNPPRAVLPGITAGTPLLTIAWRALNRQAGAARRAASLAAGQAASDRDALLRIADEAYRLRPRTDAGAAQLGSALEQALGDMGIRILAPLGEPYEGEHMDLFENVAQVGASGSGCPVIAEIVVPAVLRHGLVLRMGKAVIALP